MMKKLFTVAAIGLTLLTCHTSCTQQQKAQEAFAPIKVETPARPAGQEDVIQLLLPKLIPYVSVLSDWECVVLVPYRGGHIFREPRL